MSAKSIPTIHGHNLDRITKLIGDAWPGFDHSMQLQVIDSGWSNINLQIASEDEDYVLKLPGLSIRYDENPYEYTWIMHHQISKHGLCSKPIFKGRLGDDKSTPFIVLEFIKGEVVTTLGELSDDEALKVGATLSLFSDLHPAGVEEFSNVSEFVESMLVRSSTLVAELPSSSQRTKTQWKQLKESVDRFLQRYADSISWMPGLMHGDFQESNIVIGENVKLLDLESCAYGDYRYDIVYLYTQHPSSQDLAPETRLTDTRLPTDDWDMLACAALISVLAWSIEWLCNYGLSRHEAILLKGISKNEVATYFDRKLAWLQKLLS
ncbi:MAG: aminoglycoside phosphotransferase family protein [Candidatus Thorarchaeota archaeon]|nr:MAG: aminoglycoside phosphotransferase family protein [Candidatus Thorarchaeota archaeon]